MTDFGYKSGDTTEGWELGTQKAYRFWRYVFPTAYAGAVERPAVIRAGRGTGNNAQEPRPSVCCLLSWVSDTRWQPHEVVEGTTPDEGEQGIHGFKTMDDLFQSFRHKPEHLVIRSQISGCDGVVFGTVEMWGIIWNHAKGYRAQFARPLSFVSSYGKGSEQALAELRAKAAV